MNTLHRSLPFLILLAACTGTDVGNPVVDVDVTLYGEHVPAAAAKSNVLPANGAVEITTGWVSVSTVRLLSGGDCADEQELEIEAGVATDFFQPGSSSSLSGFAVAAGDYCQLLLELDGFDGSLPTTAPNELSGAAVVLTGTRADGTSFILESDQDEELTFLGREGTFPISDETNALVIGIDSTRLLTSINLDDAITNNEGIIHISPTSNEALLAQFQQNLDDAAKLFDDDNDDGELNANERNDDDILGN